MFNTQLGEMSLQDLIEKGCLNLGSLLFRVLDEADEMLRMGFVEDVELILGKEPLFSLTYWSQLI